MAEMMRALEVIGGAIVAVFLGWLTGRALADILEGKEE